MAKIILLVLLELLFVAPEGRLEAGSNPQSSVVKNLWLSSPARIYVYSPQNEAFTADFYKKHPIDDQSIEPHVIRIYDLSESLVDEISITTPNQWLSLTLPVRRRGVYKIVISGPAEDVFKINFHLEKVTLDVSGDSAWAAHKQWVHLSSSGEGYLYEDFYFYVPEHTTMVGCEVYHPAEAEAYLGIYSPDNGVSWRMEGETIGPVTKNDSWGIGVPPSSDRQGKLWRVKVGTSESIYFRMYGVPTYVATNPSAWFNPETSPENHLPTPTLTATPTPGLSPTPTPTSTPTPIERPTPTPTPIQQKAGKPVIVSPLTITPFKDKYYVGDTLTAKFTIKNEGGASITLDKLTAGGRLNDECPSAMCPDFTFRSPTLEVNQTYQYEGTLELTQPGNYHFFVAYYIENPNSEEEKLLDENNWNTYIDLGSGLTDEDRWEDITVSEGDISTSAWLQVKESVNVLNIRKTYGEKNKPSDDVLKKVPGLWILQRIDDQEVHPNDSNYTWWHVREAEYESNPVEGWTAKEFLSEFDSKPTFPPSYPDYLSSNNSNEWMEWQGRTINWAEEKIGSWDWYYRDDKDVCGGYCLQFVGNAFKLDEKEGTTTDDCSGEEKTINTWPLGCLGGTALAAKSSLEDKGLFYPNESRYGNPGKGALIFFNKTNNNLAGHVGIYLGGGKLLHAYGTVKVWENSHETWRIRSDVGPYIGWGYPTETLAISAGMRSPGCLRVYDSQERVTGLVNGEVKEEIPGSIYNKETEEVLIIFPLDSYHYEAVGANTGVYGLEITSFGIKETQAFTTTDIPTKSGEVHQYTTDWEALSQGEEGVNVQIDSDGDGKFEQSVTSDSELTQDEFVTQAQMARWLKEAVRVSLEEAKNGLEAAKTGEEKVNQKIDEVLKYLDKSLDESLWVDENHLDSEKGRKVFQAEAQAVRKMSLEMRFTGWFSKLKWLSDRGLPDSVKSAFEQAIDDLVKADKMLAEVAVEGAKNTPVQNSKRQRVVDQMINQAEKNMSEAEDCSEKSPDKAITKYGLTWYFAQKAIKLATEP